MPATNKPPGYEAKPSAYFDQTRAEMLRLVPVGCRRVLDVGCGRGNFAASLKRAGVPEVWGLEPVAAAAAEAATKLDRVVENIFAPEAGLPSAHFDAVIFNDVLEHVPDPAAALRLARTLLAPGGAVVASIPNIRHFPTLWELVIQADWRYTDSGILDRTHLSFFTRKSIERLFTDGGFTVEKIEGINPRLNGTARKWQAFQLINALTLGAIGDMKFLQFAVVARPAAHGADQP